MYLVLTTFGRSITVTLVDIILANQYGGPITAWNIVRTPTSSGHSRTESSQTVSLSALLRSLRTSYCGRLPFFCGRSMSESDCVWTMFAAGCTYGPREKCIMVNNDPRLSAIPLACIRLSLSNTLTSVQSINQSILLFK